MSGNTWWSTKVGAKLLFNLVAFSILSSDIPLDFHEPIRVVPLKYLMYFLAGINAKQFWNIPKEKHFVPLTIQNLFMKFFVNTFFNFFVSSFNSCLFKSVFFTKLAISLLLAKFACASFAIKFSDVNLLLSSGIHIMVYDHDP